MYDLLNFGKYNFYIWTSYFITFAALLLIWFKAVYLYKKYKKQITKLRK